ncbi:Tfp pilus assembly protein PilF [Flaviramulus basaltis]|uniref:Tfp pilus assembly protein PilF n=1 Tax=Flaviramulus basaltis TaxID=369401 RepID=A0A1K2IJW8_9FLAO|nr:tetratricopeptide repeat protein [Flaviramulus basaltis]SFZ92598.1 Tfp pilus assembly protein PilF [Flaviramulus basaltis]
MKSINQLASILLLLFIVSCNNTPKTITNLEDYNSYLEVDEKEMLLLAEEDLEFWEKKLEKEPNQFPYLAKTAASQSLIFSKTGNIEALAEAEKNLIEVNERTGYNKPGYLRSLARNYISQHKFKEALKLLEKAEAIGENLKSTEKMIFDVYLELGNYELAKSYLEKVRKEGNFDYLIRLSKWSDHRGDLDAAIKYMEQAMAIAESSNMPSTKKWIYTNIADYYGHAGNIKASYNHYLKALELDPTDAYAKKGIAWIVYSHEKNADEALRILNTITKTYNAPDYHLLKAEIAEFIGNSELKEEELKSYNEVVSNPLYGDMYNKYNALLYAEIPSDTAKALRISNIEIENRPTPQSYDLLAWTYYNHGDAEEALSVVEKHVVGKTFEPKVLFHLAKIYKANGKIDEAKSLKEELLESGFELGPLMLESIKNI